MTEHFLKHIAVVAVQVGNSDLDEKPVTCKARTVAKCYMKLKTIKIGIRYYLSLGGIYCIFIQCGIIIMETRAASPHLLVIENCLGICEEYTIDTWIKI